MKNLPSTSGDSSQPHSKVKLALATENRLYELACKARANGLFGKVPPCHKKARAVADEIAKVANYEKNVGVKPLADLGDAQRAIKELGNVKTEKINQSPGYSQIMQILKEEFQNYSQLAHQRGFDEKGEIFQLIAHFPKIGLVLQRVNVDRPYRYDGVIDDLADCTHCTKTERIGSLLGNKPRIRTTTPAVKNCTKCEQKVVDKANARLDIMSQKLEEEPADFTVDSAINPHSFEKTFKMSKDLINGTSSAEYAKAIDTLRKIWNLDIAGVEDRDGLFKDRIRQQKLTAAFNIYQEKGTGEELDVVMKRIAATADKIQDQDFATQELLLKLRSSFGGAWEKVRKNLGTSSTLYTEEKKISRLLDKVADLEAANSNLQQLYDAEVAKNIARETRETPSKSAKHSKEDKDKDYEPDKKKKKKESSSSGYVPKRYR